MTLKLIAGIWERLSLFPTKHFASPAPLASPGEGAGGNEALKGNRATQDHANSLPESKPLPNLLGQRFINSLPITNDLAT